jgi:hypothetical protein
MYIFVAKMVCGLISNLYVPLLTSAESCRECMASQPLKKMVEMGGAVVNLQQAASNLGSTASQPPDNLAAGRKKRWHASSSGVQSESLICMVLSRRA